jgi:hypothetical protein
MTPKKFFTRRRLFQGDVVVHSSINAEVSDFVVNHYAAFLGKTIKDVQIENMDGQPTPVLVFRDGSTAAVLCDPEGNGPGHLELWT